MTLRNSTSLLAFGLAAALSVAPAQAETLREALAKAYRNNPTLTAARAAQRANDENVPIQKSFGRPDAGLTGGYNESIYTRPDFNSRFRSANAQGTLSVPVYAGGGVRNAVAAAKDRVEAGQFDVRGTELTVFAQVVAAYMDVIRDSAIVSLNKLNVEVLDVNLRATNDRFEVGDLTRTDVAQSESRLSLAQASLQSAQAQLISSRERYVQLVGEAPVALQQPAPLPGLPSAPEAAVDTALANNPDLEAARKFVDATGRDVKVAGAERLPRLSVFTRGSYTHFLGSAEATPFAPAGQTNVDAAAGVSVTLPLYQGGRPAARVRQAQARQSQAMEQQTAVERSVVAQTRAFYAQWQAAQQVIESSDKAVAAADLSLTGVRAENSVGTRTILDILDAQQEAFRAQVQAVTARRDAYVAAFSLLAAMGKATASDIGLDVGTPYDPVTNYTRVRSKWFDWDDDAAPQPEARPTVDTPAQNAMVKEQG